jgi:RNA polymerase sigma-70 factor (ECF subfamily)
MDSALEIDWEAVYWHQLPRIYNFFRYRLCDDQLAEDMTATTFERAWRSRAQYCCAKGSITSWLFAIARHTAIDHLRRACPEVSLDKVLYVSYDPLTDELVQHQNDLARLADLVKQLSDRERELISLKYGADLTNREIAQLMCLSESNVAVILHRAIQRMRVMWEATPCTTKF